ncbi:RIC1-like protein [Leptotrombidium deliense]|uniref:Protein RIC1 homolog n=1 Tax=Leptotrombidium deliense TaxID=299467 RepID=A0A443SR97_9ACAR|nr:RIC1-like protein [Leptotrombidium deliense]
MYYPIGWAKSLRLDFNCNSHSVDECGNTPSVNNEKKEEIKQISANTERSLIFILTDRTLRLWFSKPAVCIVSHSRNDESMEVLGANVHGTWRPDSSMIVVYTTKDFLLFYKVICKNAKEAILEQKDVNIPGFKRESSELFIQEKIPSLLLVFTFTTKIHPGISSIMAAEEEVVVCTKLCEILGVNWDGTLDYGFQWRLRENTNLSPTEHNFYVCDIKYSSMIGGFSLVFANAKAAFMPLQSQESSNNCNASEQKYCSTRLQFVPDVDDCVITAVNHKYQLLAYGLKNSEGLLCCIDEVTSSVLITHRLHLSSSSFPNASETAGSMCCMQFSPDSTVLATSWQKGGFALWSVFGALLTCSLSWDYPSETTVKPKFPRVSSITWGKEGFELWMVENAENSRESDKITQLAMAKSTLASNPSSMSCCGESVMLIADDRLYLGVGATVSQQQHQKHHQIVNYEVIDVEGGSHSSGSDNTKVSELHNLPSTNVTTGSMSWEQAPVDDGNHQWIIVQMPFSYLSFNWPIRYSAVDKSGQHLAIAGKTGFCIYSLISLRWKLFGNETQERDFEVCGGLLWWQDYVVLSCYNVIESRFEIRAYPKKQKLDNMYSKSVKVANEVLLMSLLENRLLVLLLDGSFCLFAFRERETSSSIVSLNIVKLYEITVSNVMAPPECVTSIILSSLHIEANDNDSILMNICGKLFLLEKDSTVNTENNVNHQSNGNASKVMYKAVSILASGVENVWVSQADKKSIERPHLTDALWISCGSNGMGVWLPLLPSEAEKSFPMSRAHNFISKRIMLPINTHIYPLAVLFRDAIVLGAENDTLLYGKTSPSNKPFSVISRTSQVYLHHILRELLRRNLGIHAWEIANSCRTLPYFPHSLELLLHEVLEEEATSSQPIPDALLPRVIDFIREFPVFLETVVHCARKTELALWPHLFAVVGNPKELFQKCLEDKNLETAASYIIILQNLEKSSVSRQYATTLLDTALNSGFWQLAEDLLRFLRAIDPKDVELPPSKAVMVAATGASHPHSMKYVVSPSSLTNSDNNTDSHHFHQQSSQRKRTQSSSGTLMLHNTSSTSTSTSTTMTSSTPNSPQAVDDNNRKSFLIAYVYTKYSVGNDFSAGGDSIYSTFE